MANKQAEKPTKKSKIKGFFKGVADIVSTVFMLSVFVSVYWSVHTLYLGLGGIEVKVFTAPLIVYTVFSAIDLITKARR